ncbi:MAG: alpha/beta fold hydrolase, partial [Planctomycetia bacterium]|nr:alpha/beta fold hydrolase [Planctomycetia bacterium]
MKASGEWLTFSRPAYEPDESGWAHLRSYTTRYGIWGDGPPLVLLPGLAGGMDLLDPVIRVLARSFRVISFESRGEADCFALRRRFDLVDLADDLGEFLDWFGLESPALLGVSFGAAIALELAIRQPGRMRAMMLQGIGPRLEAGLMPRVAGMVLSRYPLPADNPFFNQFFNLFFGMKQPDGPMFDFVTRTCWRTDQGVIANRFGLLERADFAGRLRKVKVPTLLLSGDRDVLVSRTGINEMANQIADSRVVRIGGAGHLACVTHP